MAPRVPRATLFPYTTLFRSDSNRVLCRGGRNGNESEQEQKETGCERREAGLFRVHCVSWGMEIRVRRVRHRRTSVRSEEHTSELQSLRHLVCRLLLEKKKKT